MALQDDPNRVKHPDYDPKEFDEGYEPPPPPPPPPQNKDKK
jgi:hypothetical protein